jgi:hypothetical protein
VSGGLPAWVISQLRANRMCERACGREAVACVTWAAGGGEDEYLCRECWEASEAALHAALDLRLAQG